MYQKKNEFVNQFNQKVEKNECKKRQTLIAFSYEIMTIIEWHHLNTIFLLLDIHN